MNRANLTAIEKRIAAAEIVTHQARRALAVITRPARMTDTEQASWELKLAAAREEADLVVIIQRFT